MIFVDWNMMYVWPREALQTSFFSAYVSHVIEARVLLTIHSFFFQSFEKLSFNHSDENFLRLHDLKNSLSEANILTTTVHSSFNTYNEKFASAKSLVSKQGTSLLAFFRRSVPSSATSSQRRREGLKSRFQISSPPKDVPAPFPTMSSFKGSQFQACRSKCTQYLT